VILKSWSHANSPKPEDKQGPSPGAQAHTLAVIARACSYRIKEALQGVPQKGGQLVLGEVHVSAWPTAIVHVMLRPAGCLTFESQLLA
jgi:hypothetical protein